MTKIPVRHINPDSKATGSPGNFKIRDIHVLLDGKDMVQELHRHDFYLILAIQQGAGTHEIDFTRYKISDHSIFILRPGQVHQLQLKAGSTGFLLEFDAGFYHPKSGTANQQLRKASHKNFCKTEPARFEKLLASLTAASDEFAEKQDGYLDVIKANLEIFFIQYNRQSRNPRTLTPPVGTYAQDRLELFLEILGTHMADRKQVADYANMLNMSTYQLNAITKETVGMPASKLINEQVILEAKRLLLATSDQVKSIADHLGYEDISYFIRFFKKQTGYSPEAYRKKLR